MQLEIKAEKSKS